MEWEPLSWETVGYALHITKQHDCPSESYPLLLLSPCGMSGAEPMFLQAEQAWLSSSDQSAQRGQPWPWRTRGRLLPEGRLLKDPVGLGQKRSLWI